MSAPRILTILGVAIAGGWLALAAADQFGVSEAAWVRRNNVALHVIAPLGALASGHWAFVVTKKRQWQFFLQWGLLVALILFTLSALYVLWSLNQKA